MAEVLRDKGPRAQPGSQGPAFTVDAYTQALIQRSESVGEARNHQFKAYVIYIRWVLSFKSWLSRPSKSPVRCGEAARLQMR